MKRIIEELNKIALSSNNNKRMQSIDLVENFAYRTNNDLENKKKVILKIDGNIRNEKNAV